MQDHLDFGPVWYTNLEDGVGADSDPATRGPIEEEYRVNRTGQLTNAGVDYIGWETLPEPYRSSLSKNAIEDLAQFPADWPELEYEITGASLAGTDPSKRYGTIITIPVSPLSRGWVNITSADTNDLPLVNPNQLSHPTDRELAVQVSWHQLITWHISWESEPADSQLQAFKRARSFFDTQAMKPILIKEYMPGANVTSDEQILDYIMASSYQNWHASCTCEFYPHHFGLLAGRTDAPLQTGRMGKVSDPLAVVNSRAQVIGVKGLRVVDASSFRLLPPGHPQSTVCEFHVFRVHRQRSTKLMDPQT